MARMFRNGKLFETSRDLHEVTSLSRPDTSWRYTDPAGHEHRWFISDSGIPADAYYPNQTYTTPTLQWVKTGEGVYDDGEVYDIGEYRCTQCEAVVKPRFKADDTQQFIGGLWHFQIDGRSVSKEEFERELKGGS